jgi:tricorn protease
MTRGNLAHARYPDIHEDRIAFVAADDVWLASPDGGPAWRLSDDRVPAAFPRFSPDGEFVAWGSTRTSATEVLFAPSGGGAVTQATWWGSKQTRVIGWSGEEILVVSAAGADGLRDTWAYALRRDGASRRLPFGPVSTIATRSDGAVVLCSAWSREPAHWKRYRGGTAGQLWIDPENTGEFRRLLAEVTAGLVFPSWVGDRILFCSDLDGVGNLYSVLPDGADLRQHTHHSADDGYVRHPSSDGERVVYAALGRLYVLDSLDAEPREIPVNLSGAVAARESRPLGPSEGLTSIRPLADGSASVVEKRGTAHFLTHRDGPARTLAAEPGVRVREVSLLGATGQAVWVTDAGGEDALEIRPLDGSAAGLRIAGGRLGRVLSLEASPDGSRVAVVSHDGSVLVVDTAADPDTEPTGDVVTVSRSDEAEPQGLAFSPDSRYLAWSQPVGASWAASRLMIADLEPETSDPDGWHSGRPVPRVITATSGRFSDTCPQFTADGKYLAFLSVRTFDPVYDVFVFDISFPVGTRPHLMPLAADTPLPFGPSVAGWGFDKKAASPPSSERAAGRPSGRPTGPRSAADPASSDKGSDIADTHGTSAEAESTGSEGPPRTVIDVDGLEDRAEAFPVAAGRYKDLRAAEGGVWWLSEPLAGTLGAGRLATAPPDRATLHRWDFAARRDSVIVEALDSYSLSGDGSRVVVRDGDTVVVLPADHKVEGPAADGQRIEVDVARIRVQLDPVAEWRQMLVEAWRLMRDHFWRADMGGVDWDAALARYLPVIDRAGGRDDAADVIWELQAELGTSHAYVMLQPIPPAPGRAQGLLGADLAPDDDGTWRIRRILPGESSDPHARSPLRAAGVAAAVGDAVVAVGGTPVGPLGPAPLLSGAADSIVELELRTGTLPGRRVAVVPLGDDEQLRYQAWVAGRRARVAELSRGRVGYLHVPDMQAPGWAQIHRDLLLATDREGIVVDVRYNRGGHLSQLVIERLARRVIGWDLGRYRTTESYPSQAPRGPVVFVANQWSGSDGDIVCAAARAMAIGPIIGTRTWGGVVGIDGRFSLVDGTMVTQPRYATWMEGFDFGLENHGVDPDIEVPFRPQDYAAGSDPQLDRAVDEVLSRLEAVPAAVPPSIPPLS